MLGLGTCKAVQMKCCMSSGYGSEKGQDQTRKSIVSGAAR